MVFLTPLYFGDWYSLRYHVLKVIYFADKEHLSKYGRLICDDSYVALTHVPVPRRFFDIIKNIRGASSCLTDYPIEKMLTARRRLHYEATII